MGKIDDLPGCQRNGSADICYLADLEELVRKSMGFGSSTFCWHQRI
jgi:hypothetical protein